MEFLAPSIFFAALGLILFLRASRHASQLVLTSAEGEEDDFFDLAGELEGEFEHQNAAAAKSDDVIDAEVVLLSNEKTVVTIGPFGEKIPAFTRKGARKLRKRKRKISLSEKKWWVQVAITAVVLIAALGLIFARRDDQEAQKWAFGTIGLILGFWFK
jgi:hypothetical protein